MDSVALWFQEENVNENIKRKWIRDHSNIMELEDRSFIKNFRLSKEAFLYVLKEINDELRDSCRSTAIPKIIKVAATLKFLAQGGYQHQIGQDWHVGLAQQTMSVCITEVCNAIERKLCSKHINFKMTAAEKQKCKHSFFLQSGIPGIIGVIDGTHIQILKPNKDEHLYLNRKFKHSINAMVICDHNMVIRSVNARFNGASHDAHVWNLSNEREYLRRQYENGDKSSWIIGDSGYPLEPWILTPYKNSSDNASEIRFNNKFCKNRSIIERVFGILKGRFRCLLAARELHYSAEKAGRFLNVCCALHNICMLFKINLDNDLYIEPDEDDVINIDCETQDYNLSTIGKRIRNEIKNNL